METPNVPPVRVDRVGLDDKNSQNYILSWGKTKQTISEYITMPPSHFVSQDLSSTSYNQNCLDFRTIQFNIITKCLMSNMTSSCQFIYAACCHRNLIVITRFRVLSKLFTVQIILQFSIHFQNERQLDYNESLSLFVTST